MCSPAAAAVLLVALGVLPSCGTVTDTSSTISDVTKSNPNNSQRTVNEFYQMLHAVPNLINNTKSNVDDKHINLIHNLNTNHPVNREGKFDINDRITKDAHISEGAVVNNSSVKEKRIKKKRTVNVLRIDEAVSVSNIGTSEVTTTSVVSPPPMVLERRKKPGETGSSAPLLNYIFDTYSNTHQHKNERPRDGNSIYVAVGPEIEALVGSTAQLDCKVDALHDKLVSWVRRKNDEEPMVLLTTGIEQYTADDRYSARFIPPDTWRLEVREVRPADAGHYDCQLSAHPPRAARVTLRVPEVSVRIVDGAGAEVSEQVCEVGSTVALRCEVRGLRMEGGPSLLWYRRDTLLNDDTTRGGISVRTEFRPNGADSALGVARVRGDDAGQYTCTVSRSPPPAPPPAHVLLHVIKGESLAELHQGGGVTACTVYSLPFTLALCLLLKEILL